MISPPQYPDRHYAQLQRMRRTAAKAMSLTGMLAAVAITAVVQFDQPAIFAAAALAVFIIVSAVCVLDLIEMPRKVRIIPYFERTVGEIQTFVYGEQLARLSKRLDAIANDNGTRPLSEFGFNDDLCGEPLLWHDPADGLATVDVLLTAIEQQSQSSGDCHSAAKDLHRLKHALQRAADQQVRFCLLLRHCDTTSGHEWDVRKGTAF